MKQRLIAMQLFVEGHAQTSMAKYNWSGNGVPVRMYVGGNYIPPHALVQVSFSEYGWYASMIHLDNTIVHWFTYRYDEVEMWEKFTVDGKEWRFRYATKDFGDERD